MMKRLRGRILLLLCTNHDDQESRLDSSALWSVLFNRMRFDVSRDQVLTCLQDLKGRGYIDFIQQRDYDKGKTYIVMIELCPKGRDLLEGTIEDAAVEL
jgi:hypothetical protein